MFLAARCLAKTPFAVSRGLLGPIAIRQTFRENVTPTAAETNSPYPIGFMMLAQDTNDHASDRESSADFAALAKQEIVPVEGNPAIRRMLL
jgi:hypothetical protein